MGPLSGKQMRENLKFLAKEKRETAKQEMDESRKEELHEIKMQEAINKANQNMGHAEQAHRVELGGPLGSNHLMDRVQPLELPAAAISRQGSGSHLTQGHARGTAHVPGPTDTVHAMLTPGEAVIPRSAAQDPRNKPIIRRMVNEGRNGGGVAARGYADGGTVDKQTEYERALKALQSVMPNLPGIFGGAQKAIEDARKRTEEESKKYAGGTTDVPDDKQSTYEKTIAALKKAIPTLPGIFGGAQAALDSDARKKKLDDAINGYARGTTSVPMLTTNDQLPLAKKLPLVGSHRRTRGFADGTTGVNAGDITGIVGYNGGTAGVGFDEEALKREIARAEAAKASVTNWGPLENPITPMSTPDEAKAEQIATLQAELKNRGKTSSDPEGERARAISDLESLQREIARPQPNKEAKDILTAELVKAQARVKGLPSKPAEKSLPGFVDWVKQGLGVKTAPEGKSLGGAFDWIAEGLGGKKEIPKVESSDKSSDIPPYVPDPKNSTRAATDSPFKGAYGVPADQDPGDSNRVPLPPEEISRINVGTAEVARTHAAEIADAATKIKDSSAPPKAKQSMMEDFLDSIFGNKGLFNWKDLARFIVIGAGGLLTGGTVNGSLRYAARDTLASADHRHNQEFTEEQATKRQDAASTRQDKTAAAAEERSLRKSLIDQMYEPDRVEAYLKAKINSEQNGTPLDPSILGVPKTTVKKTGAKPMVYTYSSGPLMGKQFPAEEVEHISGKQKGDKEWYIKGVPVNDFAAAHSASNPAVARATSGTQLIPWVESEHGTGAIDKRYKDFADQVGRGVESIYNRDLGSADIKGAANPKRQGFPTSDEISLQTREFFRTRGDYNPDDENQKNAMRAITNQAVAKMIKTNALLEPGERTSSIKPYLAQEIIIGRSGVDSNAFMVGNKPMAANLIADMDNGLKDKIQKGNPKANASEIEQKKAEALNKMYIDWKNSKPTDKQYKGRETTSAFYQYVEDQLKK